MVVHTPPTEETPAMGLTFTAGSTSGDAPELPSGPGMYDARFDGVALEKDVPSIYDKSGKSDTFKWAFTLFEDDEPIMLDPDTFFEIDGLTSTSTNTKSKTTPRAVGYLKALMTPAEFKAFENEEPVDAEALIGRMCQVLLSVKESGWPKLENVLPARKARKAA